MFRLEQQSDQKIRWWLLKGESWACAVQRRGVYSGQRVLQRSVVYSTVCSVVYGAVCSWGAVSVPHVKRQQSAGGAEGARWPAAKKTLNTRGDRNS